MKCMYKKPAARNHRDFPGGPVIKTPHFDIHRKIDKMKRQRAMNQMKEQDKTLENN